MGIVSRINQHWEVVPLTIEVDHEQPLPQLIQEAASHSEPFIREESERFFPRVGVGIDLLEVSIICPHQELNYDEMLREIYKAQMRPAAFRHHLSICRQFPEKLMDYYTYVLDPILSYEQSPSIMFGYWTGATFRFIRSYLNKPLKGVGEKEAAILTVPL